MSDETEFINSKSDFDVFLKTLLEDFKNGKFENNSLDVFLSGLVGFSTDIDGYYKNKNMAFDPSKPTWRIFAQILKAATIYE